MHTAAPGEARVDTGRRVVEMSHEEFEDAVGDALDGIPPDLARLMDNVVILVEDDAPADDPELLGLYEGTPLTVFEAMAMGRAIASTTVDGLAEVLRDRENALLVPPRDPGALAGAILALLDDPALAARLAGQAAADSRRYDVRRTVAELEAVYEELAGGMP